MPQKFYKYAETFLVSSRFLFVMSTHPGFFFDSNVPQFATDSRYRQMFDTVPLTFDRVHHGHIVSLAFPLFKLPVELFGHVTKYLSIEDLKSLALVDRDCRKLAALSQYRILQVEALTEASSRASPFHHAHCVRRLNVTPPPWGRESIGTNTDRSASCVPFIPLVFPNLHILNWDGPAFNSTSILDSIRTSSIKHLRVRGTLMESPLSFPPTELSLCPLETLSLDIDWPVGNDSQDNVVLTEHLFRLAAPRLRQLVWKGRRTRYNADFTSALPFFPNLRSLVLDSVVLASADTLCHFFKDNTRVDSLSVNTVCSVSRNFLRNCGRIPFLRQFSSIYEIWTDCLYFDILTFLNHNDQLGTVHISHPIHPTDMDLHLLPLLNSHFDVLTSLRLVFDDIDISQQSLQAISSIRTLKRLWLSAGNQGFRSTWVIPHDEILKYLRPLAGIEILAFSQDTYVTPNPHALAPRVDYYATKALPVDLDITGYLTPPERLLHEGRDVDYETGVSHQAQMREQAWERWHAQWMLKLVNEYSKVFLALRWCFLGQLAFSGDSYDTFTTVGKQSRREPCLTSLRKVMSVDIWRPV